MFSSCPILHPQERARSGWLDVPIPRTRHTHPRVTWPGLSCAFPRRLRQASERHTVCANGQVHPEMAVAMIYAAMTQISPGRGRVRGSLAPLMSRKVHRFVLPVRAGWSPGCSRHLLETQRGVGGLLRRRGDRSERLDDGGDRVRLGPHGHDTRSSSLAGSSKPEHGGSMHSYSALMRSVE